MRQTSLLLASVCSALLSIAPAEAQTVGVSAAVNQNARGVRPGAGIRTIVLGDNVVYNERIETDTVGLLQILLADGTAFTVGPNSAISIDRFVYDPAAGTAEVTASLTKGVFRFIGGKTSKTPGGVTLNTPVGTIGIRGAAAAFKISGSGGEFALLFGKELTVQSPDGDRLRAYKQGFSVVVTKNADGSFTSEVRRTPPGFVQDIQAATAGALGTSGGSTVGDLVPKKVIESPIRDENSGAGVAANEPQAVSTAQTRAATSDTPEDAVETGSNDVLTRNVASSLPTSVPIPTPPPEWPPPRVIRTGVLTAGATYETINGDTISQPGLYGLVGGSPENDLTVSLLQADGSSFASGSIPQGLLTLPVFSDSRFTTHTITPAEGASLGGVPLNGFAYTDSDEFTAYALAINGDRTNPVYALRGTPTTDLSVVQNGDVRTYAFTEDFLQEIPVPFMTSGTLNTNYANASITPFYVAEKADPSAAESSKLFQSWLLIEGQGTSQRSAIGVNVGNFFDGDDGSYQTSFSHRGSYRANALSESHAFTGGTSSLGGLDGGNQLFGSNAQNLVLGNDIPNNDVFGDPSAFRGGSIDFGTLHVLSLTNETPIDQFTTNANATRALGAGSNTTLNGFASGIIEGRSTNDGRFLFNATSSPNVGGTTVQFDRDARSLGGEIEVGNAFTRTQIAFGDGINGNNAGGNSTFINDDIFGASHNRSATRNRIRAFDGNGNAVDTYPIVPDDSAKTYFVSGDAVPQPSLLPQGKMCNCSFLEWGWWGTQIRAQDPSTETPDENVRHGVHLGNWVAGDVTTGSEYTTFAGSTSLTTATYQGHAIGTVVTDDGSNPGRYSSSVGTLVTSGENIGRYVAAGDMSMTWNFGSASGTMEITNFDGRNFESTDLAATNLGSPATFSGTLGQTNLAADASGGVDGAFVNGAEIAQGVIGNINLSTGNQNWSAVGIIAGSRP